MKILTIDFDIIMGPSIEAYNNLIHGQKEGMDLWENNVPLLRYADADLNVYRQITKFLITAFKNVPAENIHFIRSHEEVLELIPLDEIHSIMNIDHHHDLGYAPPEATNEPLGCGNWVKYLFDLGSCAGYTWIRNPNSAMPHPEKEDLRISTSNIISTTMLDYNFIKPDKLIICASFEWIPTQFRPLFYAWIDLATDLKGLEYKLFDNNK